VGTVQGVYRQPPCLTNYRRPPPLLNGCAATADSSWRGSKLASPTPTAIHQSHRALSPELYSVSVLGMLRGIILTLLNILTFKV